MKVLKTSILIIFLLVFVNGVVSSPPDDPVKCTANNTNCVITNSYGAFNDRSTCRASQVMYPNTEQELISMVASASKSNTKVKAATRYSHSMPKLACPGGHEGIIISTNKLNHVVNVDVVNRRMTVESGVLLRDLINEAAKNGLALPYTPYWWGLTVAGLLATGAHGSSLWGKGSAVHEYVVSMRIVTPATAEEGYAKARSLNESDEELDAAKVSLGVLGVVSQVTLQLEPLFKRSLAYVMKNDSDLGEEVIRFGKEHEFGDVTWLPTQKKALYRVDDRVPINQPGHGLYDTLGFRHTPTIQLASARATEELIRFGKEHEFGDVSWYPTQKMAVFRLDDRVPISQNGNGLYDSIEFRATPSAQLAATRATEELQEATGDANGKCVDAVNVTWSDFTEAYGLTNNGKIFTGYPVIGQNNRMQTTGSCLFSKEDGLRTICPFDSRLKLYFFHETSITVPLSKVSSFIKDVEKLVELEPKALCTLELKGGLLLRYIKASSAYLGTTEDSLDFDFVYYKSKNPLVPRLFEDIFEEIEQMGLFKYGALPHWGKNRNVAFHEVIKKHPNADKFLSVKRKYDPQGIFSSKWTDQILGLKGSVMIFRDGCALEGLCICSEDRHCAPTRKYYCRPGKVYKEARVCAFEG
ncbi:L-gulonolactone oxidase 2-like isoform X1 [Neltuma alba]|uniref:L-gulonolactone oxidase 2-like isoform X1 n=1 Tax=Neltuma alba TaxID=207710 RepID=UPI0010A4F44B|nr:L-gulonolactone oxidase 2-like isoform X1 [Prosopis alba]